jgi:hypothetical protein
MTEASDILDVDLIQRDVVFFFHLQADYSHIEYDIAWHLFRQRYWLFIEERRELHRHQDQEILQRGCLLIILAAAAAQAANVSLPLRDTLEECRQSVESIKYDDGESEGLRVAVLTMLNLASRPQGSRDYAEISRQLSAADWAHAKVVQAYFKSKVDQIERERAKSGPP